MQGGSGARQVGTDDDAKATVNNSRVSGGGYFFFEGPRGVSSLRASALLKGETAITSEHLANNRTVRKTLDERSCASPTFQNTIVDREVQTVVARLTFKLGREAAPPPVTLK